MFGSKLQTLLSHRFTGLKLLYVALMPYVLPRDKRLLKMRGAHKGERCFIVANGPSLTVADMDTLHAHGEKTISVNRIYRSFDKTAWRPDYYVLVDAGMYLGDNKTALDAVPPEDLPVMLYSKRFFPKMERPGAIAYNYRPLYEIADGSKSKFWHKQAPRFSRRFSKNFGRYVCAGTTCVHIAIQLAYYLGFKEVYLLGTDCGSANSASYSESLGLNGGLYGNTVLQYMIDDYAAMARDMERMHVDMRVYNATRGGFLEVFPRVDFDSLFKK